jgi:hypothetical protein
MQRRLAVIALALAALAAPGCAADADASTEASEEEMNAATLRLVGAHAFETGHSLPRFDGIVFNADGTFFADVDTGIRCVMGPCASHVRLAGQYRATTRSIYLDPAPGAEITDWYGRWSYKRAGDALTLSPRPGNLVEGWFNVLSKETSYCEQADDCDGQDLVSPMCLGGWSCGGENEPPNRCSYSCDDVPPPTET